MATPAFLYRLMAHANLSSGFRLGEEDRIAYGFANSLRAATLDGRLRAVWTHPANELGGMIVRRKTAEGFRAVVPPLVALARALGLITGASDYLFLWGGGCCAIEFKSAKGGLRLGQRDFRDWCAANGVPFHIARSEADGLAILRGHGVLAEA
jgi:hypothetical protein